MDLAPLADDPALGADPLRNNNFSYSFPGDFDTQTRCPFAAHVRKTNPRNDLEGFTPPISTASRRIIRRGVQFGPEVTPAEALANKTFHGRGLLFVCYQSIIANGFQFIQHSTSIFSSPLPYSSYNLCRLGQQHHFPAKEWTSFRV